MPSHSAFLIAQAENGGGPGVLELVFMLVVVAVLLVGMWKVFEKAGKPGWACIVPIYNLVVMCEIAGRPVWWVVPLLIPCIQFAFLFVLMLDFAKAYGKGTIFGLGLFFLGIIFFPILGFSDAKYIGPQVKS